MSRPVAVPLGTTAHRMSHRTCILPEPGVLQKAVLSMALVLQYSFGSCNKPLQSKVLGKGEWQTLQEVLMP